MYEHDDMEPDGHQLKTKRRVGSDQSTQLSSAFVALGNEAPQVLEVPRHVRGDVVGRAVGFELRPFREADVRQGVHDGGDVDRPLPEVVRVVLDVDLADALASEPAAALRLANEHRRIYGVGGMGEAFEFVAISALTRLGDRQGARDRAARFQREFPNSLYQRQVDSIVGTP